jgi:hypothetical protein
MDWGNIAETLGNEYRRLLHGLPTFAALCAPDETPSAAFLRLEQSTTERVEYAIRCFAQDRQWPDLTATERLMLSFRVEFAGYLADWLAQQPQPSSDTEDPALFEERVGWLMLFAWCHGGFDQAANTIHFVTTGSQRKEA